MTRTLLVLAAAFFLAGIVFAQDSPAPRGRGREGADMMAQHQQMMGEMQAAQKKLDELVASMNAAKETEKVDRIAAVVTEMVALHKQMMAHMAAMPMMSMRGGMMQRGAGPGPGAASADHKQHHPDDK